MLPRNPTYPIRNEAETSEDASSFSVIAHVFLFRCLAKGGLIHDRDV